MRISTRTRGAEIEVLVLVGLLRLWTGVKHSEASAYDMLTLECTDIFSFDPPKPSRFDQWFSHRKLKQKRERRLEANELEGENSAHHDNIIPAKTMVSFRLCHLLLSPKGPQERELGEDLNMGECLVSSIRDRENPRALNPKHFLELATSVVEAGDVEAAGKPTKKQLLSLLARTKTSQRP